MIITAVEKKDKKNAWNGASEVHSGYMIITAVGLALFQHQRAGCVQVLGHTLKNQCPSRFTTGSYAHSQKSVPKYTYNTYSN
jgi:hypothetical protein